jgi:putative ABC transport system permease protein
LRLLTLITWPYVRKHLLRSALTTAGIVLGVALLVSMRAANQSVLGAFNQTVDRIAGKAQLTITEGENGFPEETLEKVQAAPEVRAAAPVIQATVDTGMAGQGRILILAVDMTGDRSLRDYDFDSGQEDVIDDPLVFLAQPDSLIVTREFADRNRLTSGSRLILDTMEGRKQFTVRGVLKPGGLAQAYGGNLGIMDIYAAQKVFGRGRRFDRIDVGVAEGVTVEAAQAALRKALGPAFEVDLPSSRGRQFENLLAVYSVSVSISSLFALFIGMFIIYNSFSIAVTQRRGEIGVLRALGATRGQVRTLFLLESATAGAVGSLAGIGVGLWAARGLANLTAATMEGVYGAIQRPDEVPIEPAFLFGAAAVGVITSMIAAWIPARNAARIEPVQALQKGKRQMLSAGANRWRTRLAAAATAVALLTLPFQARSGAFYLGYMMVVLAALLATPTFSLALARLLRPLLRWIRPVEGALAADSLIQAPRRTSATVGALMLSLALVVGQAGIARSSYSGIHDWVEGTLNPDLFVATSDTLTSREFRFPIAMRRELEQLEGVEEVQPVRTARFTYGGQPTVLVAVEMERIGARVHRNVVRGDPADMNRLTAAEKGVVVSDNFANLQKTGMGDMVKLATPTGEVRLPVVGVIRDYSNQTGTIFIERDLYVRRWQDPGVDIFRIYLQPGASAAAVKARIETRFASARRLFVLLNEEVKRYINRITDQWFALTYIQTIVAVLVAVLGIVNTLTVSIADRRREFGVLRAVGGLRAQIRGTVWMEAIAIGLIGLVLGLAVGAAHLAYVLEVVRRDFTGMELAYRFPFGVATLLLPVILGTAAASALLPGEQAARGSVVEALEYE